ncbi:MAG: hypothetical protein JWL62_3863 [Hyphomicrobiales bacterium]|nr:hypothetical protein [Hyphomicrobiales bacterium]
MKAISERDVPVSELLQRRSFLKWGAASFLALATIPALSRKARAGGDEYEDEDEDDDLPAPGYDPREYRDDEDDGD